MVFTALSLRGAFLIEPERHEDERGFFARTFCIEEFAAQASRFPSCSATSRTIAAAAPCAGCTTSGHRTRKRS